MATPGSNWGGMETHTRALASELSRRGHHVHVFAHPNYGGEFSAPVHFQGIPFQWGRRNPWLRYTLKRKLAGEKFDVIHAQGNKAARLVGRLRPTGAITVGSIHGTKSSHRDFRNLFGVIGVSARILESVDHARARLIHNGAALPSAGTKETHHAIPSERPLILAAGRLEPVKQFKNLISAFAEASLPGCLVILGEGSQRSRLEKLIQELHLEKRVLLPGHEGNLQPWFQAAHASVISSEREGFPYLMVESLLAGCPVLSTPVSGVTEFLPADAIANGTQVSDLTDLLMRSLNDREHLRANQQDSFDRARKELSLEAMAEKTVDFYRHLLSEQNQRGRYDDH